MGRPRGIIDSWKLGGPIAAQHPGFAEQEGGLTLAERAGLHFLRVRGRRDADDEGGQRIWDWFGDWLGLAYWAPSSRPHGGWRNSWPAIVTKVVDDDPPEPPKVFAKPIFDSSYGEDEGFAETLVHVPDDTRVVVGDVMVVLDSNDPAEQELLGFKVGSRLISDWRATPPEGPCTGSNYVHDLMPDGALDPAVRAGLHSFWRVSASLDEYDPEGAPIPPPYALAWNWLPTPSDEGGGHVYGMAPGTEDTDAVPSIGHMSWERGGPFLIPPELGASAFPLHDGMLKGGVRINLETAFYTSPALYLEGFGDGPKEYVPEAWVGGPTTKYPMRVEHRWDFGAKMWKWLAWSYKQEPIEEEGAAGGAGGGEQQQQATAGALMHNELCLPALTMRAQQPWLEGRDLRFAMLNDTGDEAQDERLADALERYQASPLVVNLQAGGAFVDDEPQYSEEPYPDHAGGRNDSGSAIGFLGMTPASRDLKCYRTGIALDSDLPAEVAGGFAVFSPAMYTAWVNSWDPTTGGVLDGWKAQLDNNGNLCFLPIDAAGAADPQRTLKIQGNATVAGLHNIFNFHRVTAGDIITIPSRRQMSIHGLLTVEAGGVLAISPDGQLAVRP